LGAARAKVSETVSNDSFLLSIAKEDSLNFHRNMGAYSYISPRLMTATRELNKNEKRARYVGRMVSSAPATGMSKIHKKEYNDILMGVFGQIAE
jgi:hypothetical protein